MYFFSLSTLSSRFCVYSLFAALCHAVGVLLAASLECQLPADLLFHRYFPMLEHSLMSLVLTLGGTLLIEYAVTQKEP